MLELRGVLRLGGSVATENDVGRVEVSDTALALAAGALWRSGRWRAGGGFAIGARRLAADGTTAAGAHGDKVRWTPAVAAGPEVRVVVVGGLELGAGLSVDVAANRQRFALNERVVLDVGRARLIADLFLLISTR
jgi:hypothetical protein